MAKKKRLLSEAFEISYTGIRNLESKLKNDEPIYLKGVIQRANAKNQNNRVYSREILEREVTRYKQNDIKQNRALGELDHPDSSIVEYQRASHRIHDLWWEEDNLVGKIEVLSGKYFPSANILRGCLKNNIPIGFSSRGYGSETKIGENSFSVNDDYQIICWDSVSNPSTHGAFGEFINENKKITTKQRTKKEINDLIYMILA